MEGFVGQFTFSSALVKSSKSSTVESLEGARTPSGFNFTHRNVFAADSRGTSALDEEGDIDVYFDNNQVVMHSSRLIVGG